MSSRTGILPVRSGPYSEVDISDAEFQRAVSRFLAVKDQNFAVSGSIPIPEAESTTLFFRTTSGASHSLPLPPKPDPLHKLPAALTVLLAACEPDLDEDDPDAPEGVQYDPPLVFPSNLPFSTTFDLASHPVLDTIKTVLLNKLYPGTYAYAVKDKLEIFLAGSRAGPRLDRPRPARVRDGGHLVANLVITLPVPHRGGALVIKSPDGDEEKFYPANQNKGDTTLSWTAYLADCENEVEYIEQGCRMSITYGVYTKSFGPAGPRPQPLLAPNEKLLGALSPLLGLSRNRTLGVYLTGQYDSSPADVLADTLVPYLKGSDATLYHALKAYKLVIELRWVAKGYVWPADKPVQLRSYNELDNMSPLRSQSINYPYSTSTSPRRNLSRHRRSSASGSLAGYDGALGISGLGIRRSGSRSRSALYDPSEEEEDEYLEDMEAEGGAVLLQEANITVLTPRDETVFKTIVPVVSKGQLEQVPVHVMLLFYIG